VAVASLIRGARKALDPLDKAMSAPKAPPAVRAVDPLDKVMEATPIRGVSDPLDTAMSAVPSDPVERTIFSVRTDAIIGDVQRVRERATNVSQGQGGLQETTALLGRDSFNVVDNLSDLEIASINFYTRKGDEVVNKALREDSIVPGSDLDQTINFMNQTLDKLPAHKGVVYRGIKGESFDDFEVGSVYSDKGFMSTTVEPLGVTFKDIAEKGALKPRRRTVLVIQSESGKYIEPLTFVNFAGENEVLFKPGTRFRIVDKDPDTKQVLLQELLD